MHDWYYHDPGQGRVGPHSAEDLLKRYRERRIQRDTLVWRDGLREWQPLERVSDEIGLDGVAPDAALPPPLPPNAGGRAVFADTPMVARPAASGGRAGGTYARSAPPPRQGLSGCAIVAIVAAVLAIPVIGILAAIAIPAYNDYVQRAKAVPTIVGQAAALKNAVEQHMARTGGCPGDDSPGFAALAQQARQAETTAGVRFGRVDGGHCAFELTLRGLDAQADGKTVLYVAVDAGSGPEWDCSGGSLPNRYRPAQCRAAPAGP